MAQQWQFIASGAKATVADENQAPQKTRTLTTNWQDKKQVNKQNSQDFFSSIFSPFLEKKNRKGSISKRESDTRQRLANTFSLSCDFCGKSDKISFARP